MKFSENGKNKILRLVYKNPKIYEIFTNNFISKYL